MDFRIPPWIDEHPFIYTALVLLHFAYAVVLFELISIVHKDWTRKR